MYAITTRALAALLAAVWLAAPSSAQTTMPPESAAHEGTWLQWPHPFTYGPKYAEHLEPTWIAMTAALVTSENVHIIAYDASQQARVAHVLLAAGISLARVNFVVRKTDDCWVRDNGPIFAWDAAGAPEILDWRFNGWGLDAPYALDDTVPQGVAHALAIPRVDLSAVELEGGAVEVDGHGVFMATRSSILDPLRNPNLTQFDLERALTQNLGVSKFIWLDGTPGGKIDITDQHIDGTARFGPHRTIVTMNATDLNYWGLSNADVNTLYAASDIHGAPYHFVIMPLTANKVVTTYGYDVGFKGCYVNYYIANSVVLMPTYNDPNDGQARAILQQLYPDRAIVEIDCRNLYREGGMVHCVTQQQPLVHSAGR